MKTRLLSAIGAGALLAFFVGGVVAWKLVGDGVNVMFSEGAGPSTDPTAEAVALLEGDVASLREDLRGLTEALGRELGALYETLDASTTERAGTIERQLDALATRMDELLDQRELTERVPETAGPTALAPEPEPMPAEEPRTFEPVLATERVIAAPEHEGSATQTTPLEVASRPQPPKRSFLSFSLPSDSFDFDTRQRFEVVPSLSRVGFDGRSTIHDFTGATSAVSGELAVRLAQPNEHPRGEIRVRSAALDTGDPARDKGLREHLEVEAHPELRFLVSDFQAASIDAAGGRVTGTVRGEMTIHGISRPLAMPVEVTADDSHRLLIEGAADLSMTDYEVEVPSKLGLINMEETVRVWISIRARYCGPDTAGDGAAEEGL